MEREKRFIKRITNEVYKLIVLRESEMSGENVYLDDFIAGLYVEVNGACCWSEQICESENFVAVTSIIAYFATHLTSQKNRDEFTFKRYRSEVFKMLGLLNKTAKELEG